MKDLYKDIHHLLKFKQIPIIECGDSFIPDKEIIDQYFQSLNDDGFTDYEDIKQQLLDLVFTREEIEEKITNGIDPKSYTEWRNQFDNYWLNQCYAPDIAEQEGDASGFEQAHNQRVVLNRHNPFAQVTIESQGFLYPGKNGYDVLAFTTNQHFVRKETENGDIYAITPGFKISKQKQRKIVTDIVATDSVSSPLPEKKDNKQIIYI